MRALICGVIVIVVVGIAGCGGGGGAPAGSFTMLPQSIAGTYHIQGLNLPNDRLGVKSGGDVVVNSDTAVAGGSSQAKIGSCSSQGAITLNGSWTSGGQTYSISGSGSIASASHGLTLQAVVNRGGLVSGSETTVTGEKIGDFELPPPPPDYPDTGGDDMINPPPPPDYP